MKSILKKTAISMLVMGMAGTASAAMSHNTSSWSPHMNGWFIGVDGLDLRPMNGDLDFVTLYPTSDNGSFYNQAISPDYQWSWRFYGGIKFTDNDDITVSWQRMRASDGEDLALSHNFNARPAPRWLFNNTWDTISGNVDFDLDDVYAVWGHTVNFNNPWSVRFAAGVDYVKLNSDLLVQAEEIYNNRGVFGFDAHNHLKGFGPRVEFDATYHLPYNFALFANTNAALFVSERKISLQPAFSDDENSFPSFGYSTRHVAIPKFGARLGASYGWMFGQSGGEGGPVSTLTIDAGWQVESYIHAIERPDFGNNEDFAGSKTSNFSDQGWFIGLKYGSDWM